MWPVECRGQPKLKRVPKEWGEEIILHNADFCAKVLRLDPGKRSSLHLHPIKSELFYVMSGRCWIKVGRAKAVELVPGNSVFIPPETAHQFWNDYENPICDIFESSTHHEDIDTVRFEPSGWLPR